jgi:NitT/TauT family transport system permease protein
MENARQFTKVPTLMSYMVVILVIGILLDAFVFGAAERAVRRRWGLADSRG